MHCQALDQGEVLCCRWAHDDPNPVAKDSMERADKDAMVALLQAKGVSLTPAGFNYPAEYQMPEPKRLRIEDGGSLIEQHPELAYPNTDNQYEHYYQLYSNQYYGTQGSSQTVSTSTTLSQPVDKAAAQRDALLRLGITPSDSVPSEENNTKKRKADDLETNDQPEVKKVDTTEEPEEEAQEEGNGDEEEEGGWQQFVDENTGAMYYFNTSTGESSWTKPAALQE